MTVEAIAIALHHSRARNSTVLAVLVGIANHDGDGGAWPTVRTLAHYARVQDRSVQNALSELERLGEIDREIQRGGTVEIAHWDRPNLYHFKLKCPTHCDGSRSHKLICQGCGKPLPKTSQTVQFHTACAPSLANEHPVQVDAPGAPECTGPVHADAPKTYLETTTNDHEETYVVNRARKAPSDASGAAPIAPSGTTDGGPAQAPTNDASGDSHRPASASAAFDLKASLARATAPRDELELETCPQRGGFMPHSYSPKTGDCIDCGAPDPERVNYKTGEVE